MQDRILDRLVWLALAAPLAVITYLYLAGHWFYGEYIQATGDWATKLLIVAMAVTPLRRLFPNVRLLAWLLGQRRYIGLAAFGYAVAHLIAYVVKVGVGERIVSEALEPGMLAGWVALFLFLPLAVTSNDSSVTKLGLRWKHLHRLVYIAAVLTFMHWIMEAFDPVEGYVHAGVLLILEVYRLSMNYLDRRSSLKAGGRT